MGTECIPSIIISRTKQKSPTAQLEWILPGILVPVGLHARAARTEEENGRMLGTHTKLRKCTYNDKMYTTTVEFYNNRFGPKKNRSGVGTLREN